MIRLDNSLVSKGIRSIYEFTSAYSPSEESSSWVVICCVFLGLGVREFDFVSKVGDGHRVSSKPSFFDLPPIVYECFGV